jgi:SAM-dependent methyltransferase
MPGSSEAQVVDPYADLAELYDLEHAGLTDDLELYRQLTEVVGDPVLELGCGTGRILAPLAAAGFRVVGIDRSEPMLNRAHVVLAEEIRSGRVQLAEGEMVRTDDAPGGPFGLIIFSLNGLMHLATPCDQRVALAAARRALDPRGMLAIDVLNPTPELLMTFDGRVVHEGNWRRADGSGVDRYSSRVHSAATQQILTETWYDVTDANGAVRRVRSSFPLRYLTRSEIELMLELAGFVEWQVYGSYALDPYADDSERLIVTAEVTASARSS